MDNYVVQGIEASAARFLRQYQVALMALVGEVLTRMNVNIIHAKHYHEWSLAVDSWSSRSLMQLTETVGTSFESLRGEIDKIEMTAQDARRINDFLVGAETELALRVSGFVSRDALTAASSMRQLRVRAGMAHGNQALAAVIRARKDWEIGRQAFLQADSLNRRYQSEGLLYRSVRGALVDAYVEAKICALKSAGVKRVQLVNSEGVLMTPSYAIDAPVNEQDSFYELAKKAFHPQTKHDFVPAQE